MSRRWFVVGTIVGASAVVLGAFGAHGLEGRVDPRHLEVWDLASRYQLAHALALIAASWACERWPGRAASAAGWLFLAGVVLFCGSLYALALTGARLLGAITPLGGIAFIAGWAALAIAAWRGR